MEAGEGEGEGEACVVAAAAADDASDEQALVSRKGAAGCLRECADPGVLMRRTCLRQDRRRAGRAALRARRRSMEKASSRRVFFGF